MSDLRIGVIGLDGLSWSYFNKMLNSGAMPYTRSFLKKGIKSYLYAFPPLTPPSWTSIMTGVNPAKHGISDFLYFDEKYNYRLVNSTFLEHPRIHEMLSMIGVKSIVINPFPSYPLYRIRNCIQISCQFFTPKNEVYPPRAEKYLRYLKQPSKPVSSFTNAILDAIDYANRYLELVEALIEQEDFRLLWINMNHPDRYLHKIRDKDILYSKIVDEEYKLFQITDKIIKIIDENVDNLIVVSDHGFSYYEYVIELNTYLYREGYAQRSLEEKGLKELWEIPEFQPVDRKEQIGISIDNALVKLFLKQPLRPLGRALKRIYERISGREIRIKAFDVDPRRSKAFVPTYTSFAVKVVDTRYIEDIIRLLRKVEGIKNVYRREELFNGPFINRLPEVYIEPDFEHGFTLGGTKIRFDIIKKRPLLHHHPLGVFFIKYWDFDTRFPNKIPNYMVANIILSLFDVPLSHMADGVDLLSKLLDKDIKLTDLYLKRWNIIKKLSLVKLN